ncbi:MAG: hypothetical protein ABIS29_00060, partial [Vicinamibacterales bacterium]
ASPSFVARILALPRELAIRIVPGFEYLRDEYRFLTLASLGVYGLAAIGMEAGFRALQRRSNAIAVLAIASLFLFAGAPLASLQFPLREAPSTNVPPAVYHWLRDHGEGGPVLELPMSKNRTDDYLEAGYMFNSTYHWLPLINGYTGHPPRAHYEKIRNLVSRLPDENSVEELRYLTRLRWIVIHDALYQYFGAGGWEKSPHFKQIGDFDGGYLIEVVP